MVGFGWNGSAVFTGESLCSGVAAKMFSIRLSARGRSSNRRALCQESHSAYTSSSRQVRKLRPWQFDQEIKMVANGVEFVAIVPELDFFRLVGDCMVVTIILP